MARWTPKRGCFEADLKGRFEGPVQMTLSQDGNTLTGCYDYKLDESFESSQPAMKWVITRRLPSE